MSGAGGWGERGEKTRGKSGFILPRPKKRDAGSQSTFNLLPVQLSGTTKAWPKVSPVTWAGSAGPTPEPPKRGWVLEMGRALPLPSRGCWGMAVVGFVLGPLPPCVARELGRGKGEHLGLNRSSPQRILVGLEHPYCTIAEAKSNRQAALKWGVRVPPGTGERSPEDHGGGGDDDQARSR